MNKLSSSSSATANLNNLNNMNNNITGITNTTTPTTTTTIIGSNNSNNSNGKETSVRVAVRIRPISNKEKLEKCRECAFVDKENNQIVIGKDRTFAFDYVFDQNTLQQSIYDTCVQNLVDGLFQGYNATVLAYGQTGSGKTFTMGTANHSNLLLEEEMGIIPRVIHQIFNTIENYKLKSTQPTLQNNLQNTLQNSTLNQQITEIDFTIKVSFLEIYNENIKDLLSPQTSTKSIQIREDDKKGIIVSGVKEEIVTNFDELMNCLETGTLYRTVGSTLMNEVSSRSHSIFTIFVEQKQRVVINNQLTNNVTTNNQENDSNQSSSLNQLDIVNNRTINQEIINNNNDNNNSTTSTTIIAKFHLIDLAGSERTKRTGAVGIRFKEAVQINCGLLALGNVISALGDEKKIKQQQSSTPIHVPYRDSKLTRLLQDSLGGNSSTLMIACISPADSSFEETLNTLKYANRARNIKNKLIVNRDPQSMQLAELKSEIQALKLALLQQKMLMTMNNNGNNTIDNIINMEGYSSLEELLKFGDNQRFLSEVLLMNKKQSSTTNNQEVLINNVNSLMNSNSSSVESTLREELKLMKEQLSQSFTKTKELDEEISKIGTERDQYLQRLQLVKQRAKDILIIISSINWNNHFISKEKFTNIISNLEWISSIEISNNNNNALSSMRSSFSSTTSSIVIHSNNANNQQQQSNNNSNELIRNNSNELIQEKNQEIESLKKEVKDAKDDLKRDEKIFMEKMREIKRLSKTNWVLKKNLQTLKYDLDIEVKKVIKLEEYIQSLPEKLGIHQLPPLSDTDNMSSTTNSSNSINNSEENKQDNNTIVMLNNNNEQKDINLMNQIEEEKLKIEQEMQEYQKNHLKNQKKLEQSLKDLTLMIKLKEELIRDLLKSEHESIVLREQYEKKIKEMEIEMIKTQMELDKVMKDLENADIDKFKKEEEKKRIQSNYELILKKQNENLEDLKRKANESEKLIKLKYQSDKKIKNLQNEINKMKLQQDYLKNKLMEEHEKQTNIQNDQLKLISKLKKQSESVSKRMKDLEIENQKQKVLLLKRSEELQKQQLQLNRVKSINNKQSNEQQQNGIDKQKQWLDKEIEKYISKKEAMETLEKELKRRESILLEKEKMLAAKQNIEIRKFRKSQVIQDSLQIINKQIETINREIVEKEMILKSKKTSNSNNSLKMEAKIINELQEEIDSLHLQREKYLLKKERIEMKGKNQMVREEEVLREINERTEVLDAEIEYKNETIEQLVNQNDKLKNIVMNYNNYNENIDHYNNELNEYSLFNEIRSLGEAKVLLRQYFEKVIELKEDEYSKKQSFLKLELSIKEKDKVIENLQNNIRLTEMVYERKLIKLQKENEQKITYLLKQIVQYDGSQRNIITNNTINGNTNNSQVLTIDTEKIDRLIKQKDEQIQKLEKKLSKLKQGFEKNLNSSNHHPLDNNQQQQYGSSLSSLISGSSSSSFKSNITGTNSSKIEGLESSIIDLNSKLSNEIKSLKQLVSLKHSQQGSSVEK